MVDVVFSLIRCFRNRLEGWFFRWYRDFNRDGYLLDGFRSKPFGHKLKHLVLFSSLFVASWLLESFLHASGIGFPSVFSVFFFFASFVEVFLVYPVRVSFFVFLFLLFYCVLYFLFIRFLFYVSVVVFY